MIAKNTEQLVYEAFLEGIAAGYEDAEASMRPIAGGFGVQGPVDPDALWRQSDAFKAVRGAIAAQAEPVDRFTAATRDMARSA